MSALFLAYILFTGFLKIYLTGNMQKNSSGSLHIVYSAPINEVESSNFQLGNFPFGETNIRRYFSSNEVILNKLQVVKPGDSAYMVIINLDFKSIVELNKLKGFSDNILTLTKSDSGTVFEWKINSNEGTKMIKSIDYNLTFESDLISSNGIIKGQNIRWFKTDFNNQNVLKATLAGNIDVDEIKNPEKDNILNQKKCGLFGYEFPFILFTGLITLFLRKSRKRNYKKEIHFLNNLNHL